MPGTAAPDERPWQRLDHWLWCARFMRHRADCTSWVEGGLLRLNRVPVAKPHFRLRVGDVLILPFSAEVRVVEVLALASRRGPAPVARTLYRDVAAAADGGCGGKAESSYPPPEPGQTARSAS